MYHPVSHILAPSSGHYGWSPHGVRMDSQQPQYNSFHIQPHCASSKQTSIHSLREKSKTVSLSNLNTNSK